MTVAFAIAGAFASGSPDVMARIAWYVYAVIDEDGNVIIECRQSTTDDICTTIVQANRCQVVASVPNKDAWSTFHCTGALYKP